MRQKKLKAEEAGDVEVKFMPMNAQMQRKVAAHVARLHEDELDNGC